MNLQAHILSLAMLAVLTPRQRFSSVGSNWRIEWLRGWNLAIIGAALLVLLMVVGVLIHLARYRRQIWGLFDYQSRAIGLDQQQRQILDRMARTARLRNPTTLLMSAETFDKALAGLSEQPDEATVQAMRDQLGLSVQLNVDLAAGQVGEEPLELVLVTAAGKEVRGRLVSAAPGRTRVRLDQPVLATLGETWQLRYAAGGSVAQMLGRLVQRDGVDVSLVPISRARVLERRRFRRVSDSRVARLGTFTLLRPEHVDEGLKLHEGMVIDSGGPGMKLRMPKPSPTFHLGQRTILLAQLREGCCLQAVGRVRRVEESEQASLVSLELIDLEAEEKGQLMRELSRTRQAEPAPASSTEQASSSGQARERAASPSPDQAAAASAGAQEVAK